MAVYTDVPADDLRRFVAAYDIGEVVSFDAIAEGIENSNYLLRTADQSYILTLYEKRVSPDELPFFLGLMDHLSARGIPCPVPVRGRDGEALRTLRGKPAAIVTFLPGAWPRRVAPAHCAALGAVMARMHLAGAEFAPSRLNDLSVAGWRRLYEATRDGADDVRPGLAAEIDAELAAIEAGWPSRLPRGVIHADLFPDNVFFLGDAVSGVIDFYFACTDILAYDLAVSLNAWCFEDDGSFDTNRARRMLESYHEIRPLDDAELDALPLLARGAALRFLLTRLFDWLNRDEGALVTPKDPIEFLVRLRFHRGLEGRGGYGLE